MSFIPRPHRGRAGWGERSTEYWGLSSPPTPGDEVRIPTEGPTRPLPRRHAPRGDAGFATLRVAACTARGWWAAAPDVWQRPRRRAAKARRPHAERGDEEGGEEGQERGDQKRIPI